MFAKPPIAIGVTVGFGAAGDHDVGVAVLDRAERVADRVRARGAGGDGGVVRALAR